jgi:hypothetical protein
LLAGRKRRAPSAPTWSGCPSGGAIGLEIQRDPERKGKQTQALPSLSKFWIIRGVSIPDGYLHALTANSERRGVHGGSSQPRPDHGNSTDTVFAPPPARGYSVRGPSVLNADKRAGAQSPQ